MRAPQIPRYAPPSESPRPVYGPTVGPPGAAIGFVDMINSSYQTCAAAPPAALFVMYCVSVMALKPSGLLLVSSVKGKLIRLMNFCSEEPYGPIHACTLLFGCPQVPT